LTESVHHRLQIREMVGPLRVNVDVAFGARWTLIFGPSGSGKSSLLRAMCGLLGENVAFSRRELDSSWLALDAMPISQRGLSYAPQSPWLFPHLNVEENVAFAAKSRRGNLDSSLIERAMDTFYLSGYEARMPTELSGGERQRVSLARAFAVPDAELLLPRMQAWLTERGLPVVSVSHDVDEALLLRAEVLRLESGRVLAQGYAAEVLADERARMVWALG
jgi:molybdate transport system ATP-binding protein